MANISVLYFQDSANLLAMQQCGFRIMILALWLQHQINSSVLSLYSIYNTILSSLALLNIYTAFNIDLLSS